MVGASRSRTVYSLTNITPARTIWVYRNGDPFYMGRKFILNHRYVPNFEAFMIQLNETVPTPFGVRKLYTPREGHSVKELPELQQGGRYVVAGRERFKKLNYYDIGAKKPQRKKREESIRPVVHSNIKVPSKWQSVYNKPRNINVFTNGDTLIPPVKILIPKFTLSNWNAVLGLVNEKVFPCSGCVHRLYTLDGHPVHGPDDLEDNQFYVARGREKFQYLPYWHHPKVPKHIRRKFSESPEPPEKPPPTKQGMEQLYQIQDIQNIPGVRAIQMYKSSLLAQIVLAVGNTAYIPPVEVPKQKVRGQPRTQASRRGEGDRASVYYAKPEEASREKASKLRSPDDVCSVYKAQKSSEEIKGAREIPEDKDTQVDIPIDQAPAEVIQDEEIYSEHVNMIPKASAEIVQDENIEDQAKEGEIPQERRERTSVFKKMLGFFFSRPKTDTEEQEERQESKTQMGYSENERYDDYVYD